MQLFYFTNVRRHQVHQILKKNKKNVSTKNINIFRLINLSFELQLKVNNDRFAKKCVTKLLDSKRYARRLLCNLEITLLQYNSL